MPRGQQDSALAGDYGEPYLKITTNPEQAQAYFNQGLRLLHCFWDCEADRAFKEAAEALVGAPTWGPNS